MENITRSMQSLLIRWRGVRRVLAGRSAHPGGGARPQAVNRSTTTRSALALALTVVIGYGIIALLLLAWPGLATGIMKTLFHGLDLFHLQPGPDLLSFPFLLYALLGTIACVVALCFVYSWIRDKLLG